MRTFDLLTPAAAMNALNAALSLAHHAIPIETIPSVDAYGRVLARAVVSPTPLPEFRRSTVDGFAVQAASVSAAPVVLKRVGEVKMGEISALRVGAGEAAQVHTGGHVPEGADAVVMVEQTTEVREADGRPTTDDGDRPSAIQINAPLNSGDNVIQAGEDVQAGDEVVRAGTQLREQELGGILALGIREIEVYRQPRVAIIASGDELVSATSDVKPGQIRNINAPMMEALVKRCGGVPVDFGILPDRRDAFEVAAQKAIETCDVVIFMAGSSVGERDFVPDVVNGMGKPGILVHGIQFRPGKPTLFAVCDGGQPGVAKPVFGLPGNPISALVTAMMFVQPTLWRVQGAVAPLPNFVSATLAQDVKSPRDLEHWVPVALSANTGGMGQGEWVASPISTKSNLIFGLVRADGLMCVPIGTDKLAAGTPVQVRLFA